MAKAASPHEVKSCWLTRGTFGRITCPCACWPSETYADSDKFSFDGDSVITFADTGDILVGSIIKFALPDSVGTEVEGESIDSCVDAIGGGFGL